MPALILRYTHDLVRLIWCFISRLMTLSQTNLCLKKRQMKKVFEVITRMKGKNFEGINYLIITVWYMEDHPY